MIGTFKARRRTYAGHMSNPGHPFLTPDDVVSRSSPPCASRSAWVSGKDHTFLTQVRSVAAIVLVLTHLSRRPCTAGKSDDRRDRRRTWRHPRLSGLRTACVRDCPPEGWGEALRAGDPLLFPMMRCEIHRRDKREGPGRHVRRRGFFRGRGAAGAGGVRRGRVLHAIGVARGEP